MKWSEHLSDGYYHKLIEKGAIKESDNEPNIEGLEFYIYAFRELDSCRSISFSVGPIPFTAIVEYFKLYPVGAFEEFHYVIRAMDNAFLKNEVKKSKETKK